MHEDDYRARIEAIEAEATRKVNALIFKGVKPVGIAPTVDVQLREAARARGNQLQHQAEIDRIRSDMLQACEAVDSEFYDGTQ